MDPSKTNGLPWTRPAPPQERTIFKPECVRVRVQWTDHTSIDYLRVSLLWFVLQEVAESIGINSLPDEIAEKLASDVEYRIHQVVQVCSHSLSLT